MHLVDDRPPPSDIPVVGRHHRAGRVPVVLVVSGSVGAGHDAAASELARRLTASGVRVEVRDLLTALPVALRRCVGGGYGACVNRAPGAFDLVFRGMERDGALWQVQRWITRAAMPVVAGWCDALRPDLVVSTYPMASQALGELRRSGRLAAPVLTYLTDPAAHRSWLHPAVTGHLTVGAATALHGRRAYGATMTVAGPLVAPQFSRTVPRADRAALRRRLTTAPGPLALVAAGSLGIGAVVPTVTDLVTVGVTPVVLCGSSPGLRRAVSAQPGAVALGWRDDVAHLMAAADVLVHNAGGMTCTEAWVAGLPVVTHRPIPGHGRANAAVLADAGIAPWTRDRETLAQAVAVAARSGRPRVPGSHPDPARLVLEVLGRRPARPLAG